MDNKINFIKNKVRKHSKKFSLFLIIGIFKTAITIALTWLLIDILKISTLLVSTTVITLIFFITYFTYVITKIIKPKFIKYASATIGFNVTTILLIWLLVDFMEFSGVLSSIMVIGVLFIIRYVFFNKIGLINHG